MLDLYDYPIVVEIPVAWGEMDYFHHVNNTVYFRYFESARVKYVEAIKIEEYMAKTKPVLDYYILSFEEHHL